MKVHWRTEDRWLREFRSGHTILEIAAVLSEELDPAIRPSQALQIVEDAIRRAILRRERRGKRG